MIEFVKRVGESDKMRGLQSILSLFRNEFNKYNTIGACMLYLSHDFKIVFVSAFLV